MEFLEFSDIELSEKFKDWWLASSKKCIPILHPLDLERFATLIKCSLNKQDIFNSTILYNFLCDQLEKGNINKNEKDNIFYAISLYDFSVNYLLK